MSQSAFRLKMASPYVTTLFGQSIKSVLDGWTALQLAVTHSFGGPDSREKAEWMVYAIETWFKENANIETYELEEFLADVMNAEFDMILEDSSALPIAVSICKFHRLCGEGREEEVRQSLQSLPQADVQQCAQADTDQEVQEGEMNDDEQAGGEGGAPVPQSQHQEPAQQAHQSHTSTGESEDMEVEDGWEVVRRGKKK